MPQVTFSGFVASRAAIFGLEVERSREVLEVSEVFLYAVMSEMLLPYCIDVLEGKVFNVDESSLNEVGKKVPIGLPPLLCFGGCGLGRHLAEMGRPELSCVVWLVGKNDKSANKITKFGAI